MTPSDPAGAGAPPLDIAPEEFRRLGERLLAALEDYRRRLPERPARPVEPEETVRLVLNQALPETGADPDAIVDFLVENILPYPLGNDHPRFFAWITAPGSPIGALADLAATATNTVTGGPPRVHAGLERCVTRWLMELAGFPTDGSYGLLVSGGTVANLTALTVARHWAAKRDGWNIRAEGLQGHRPRYTIYATREAHSCIQKSVELLGLGTDNLREVPIDGARRMDVAALARMVASDRAAGLRPFCAVASAGTVNIGAVDPLADPLAGGVRTRR